MLRLLNKFLVSGFPDRILCGAGWFLVACLPATSFQQPATSNIWYFGNQAGLDFNMGFPPTPLLSGQMDAWEGCASIADENGQLLFYTDGTRVWDSTHTPMPNANGTNYPADWDRMLTGDISSSQAAIITSVISQPNRYYVFTIDGVSGLSVGPKGLWDGLYYTVIDMTLNNGKGDIDTAYIRGLGYTGNKIPLIDSTAEKITAVKHANGCDYWIVTRKAHFVDAIYAFLVTSMR